MSAGIMWLPVTGKTLKGKETSEGVRLVRAGPAGLTLNAISRCASVNTLKGSQSLREDYATRSRVWVLATVLKDLRAEYGRDVPAGMVASRITAKRDLSLTP